MDDGNLKLKSFGPGASWDSDSRSVIYSDFYDGRLPDQRTAEVIKCVADSFTPMLVWTVDFPSANPTGRLPILDIQTWCEETTNGTRTCYSFYSKPMANPIAIPSTSAIPSTAKFSTYRQEVCRILRNTSIHLPWALKADLLTEFS